MFRSLLTALALGALAAPVAQAADTPHLTCAASAARILDLAEAAAVGGPGECAPSSRTVASAGSGLISLLPVKVTALEARTDRPASAVGQAGSVRIGLPGATIEARELVARASASCVDGRLATSTSGAIADLEINGNPVAIGDGPLTIPLGAATLRLNHTATDGAGVVRRALALDSLLGSVVVGEARAGASGDACRTEPGPEPTPISAVDKTVDATDGAAVTDRTAQPGETVTYRIRYRNTGDAPATGVVVSDALDRQAFVECTASCTHAEGTVSWTVGHVPAGEHRDLVVRATLPASADQAGDETFVNQASASDQVGTATSGVVTVRASYAPRIVVVRHMHHEFNGEGANVPTAEPIELTGVGAGTGIYYQADLRNDGTAPADDLVVTDLLADAFENSECERDGCTLTADGAAPAVLDPAGPGTRVRYAHGRLGIGQTVELNYRGLLKIGDYAADTTVLQSQATVSYTGGSVALPRLQATVQTPAMGQVRLWGYRDNDGDGVFEDGEYIPQGQAIRGGRPLAMDVAVQSWGHRSLGDGTTVLPLGPGLVAGADVCSAVAAATCSYDAGTNAVTLGHGPIAREDTREHRLIVRVAAGFTGDTAFNASFSSPNLTMDATPFAFSIRL